MSKFIIIYGAAAVLTAAANCAAAYFQHRVRVCRIAVSVIYVLTLAGILFAMSVLEGKYSMSMLHSSILAAAVLALVCFGEFVGNRLSKRNGKED